MRAVLGGGGGGSNAQAAAGARQRQQAEYAAELRQQVAAKEAAKAAERAHSLRQSAAHLALRAAAAVLPGGGRSGAAQPAWASPQRALPTAPPEPPWGMPPSPQRQLPGRMPAQPPQGWDAGGGEPWRQHEPPPHEHRLPPGYPGGAAPLPHSPDRGWQPAPAVQPPYGWDAGPQAAPPPQWRSGFAPTQQAAPFATDLQPPQQVLRRPSMRYAAQPEPHALPPWAAGELEAPQSPPAAVLAAAGSGCLASIGAAPEADAVRRQQVQRQAAFAAELSSQLAAKEAQRRRERERERAEDASKAAEAQRMLAAKARRGYGGGSGPLRDAQGHAVTDLNEVRRYQAAAVASPQRAPAAGAAAAAALERQSIAAHWGGPAAHEHGAAGEPGSPGGWAGGVERGGGGLPASPERQPSDAWPQQQHQQWGMPPPQRQPSRHAGWLDQPPAEPASLLEHGSRAPPSAASLPPPAAPSPTQAAAGPGPAALVGSSGSEAQPLRMRSDRPFETSTEAERRMQAQVEFKEALRRQVEENARLKAAELQRQRAEEAEEEARLERERERLRQAFEADQSRQRAKAAAKEAAEGEGLESGGISIKVGKKPPPARAARSSAARPRSPPPPIAQPPPPARQLSRQGSVGGEAPPQARGAGATEAEAGPAALPAAAPVPPAARHSSTHDEWRGSRQQESHPTAPSQQVTPSAGLLQSESQHLQAWQQPPAGSLPLLQPPWALYMQQQQQQQQPYPAGPPGWGPGPPMLPPQQAYSQAPMAPAPWALPPLPLAALSPPWAAPPLPPLTRAAPWLQHLHGQGPSGQPPPQPPPQQWAPAPAHSSPAITVGRPSVPFRGAVYETHSALSAPAPASRPPTGRGAALPALPSPPAAPPATGGLREWDALLRGAAPAGVPFSRQSSPTPPGPSEQDEAPPAAAAAWGAGRAGGSRRGSGTGLFASDRLTSGAGGWRG